MIQFYLQLTITANEERKHENKEKEAENDYLVNGYLVIFIKICAYKL